MSVVELVQVPADSWVSLDDLGVVRLAQVAHRWLDSSN